MQIPVTKACLREAVGRATNPTPGQEGVDALIFDDELGMLVLHYAGELEAWAIPLHNVKGFRLSRVALPKFVEAEAAPAPPATAPVPDAPPVAPVALIPRRRGRPPTKSPAPSAQAVPLAATSGRTHAGPAPEVAAMLAAAAPPRAKSRAWATKPPANGLAVRV